MKGEELGKSSVVDPDPVRSEILFLSGSGSGSGFGKNHF
jgi:hypothetical protein